MDTSRLPFPIAQSTKQIISSIERTVGKEILLREGEFNRFDEPAAVQGGFDRWVLHVTVNRLRVTDFDEHGLLHELLHIKRFVEGAFTLETPEAVAGVRSQDADVRKAFATDVTNQIEHIAIFPEIEKLGLDPHAHAEKWKARQIAALAANSDAKFGPVDVAWLSIKVGVSEFLGQSQEVQEQYRASISRAVPAAISRGEEIAELIRRFGVTKQYNLRRLYQLMLLATDVPKRALLLKELHFSTITETLDPIP